MPRAQDEIAKLAKALEEAGTQRAEEKKVFLKVSAEQNAAIAIIEKAKEVCATRGALALVCDVFLVMYFEVCAVWELVLGIYFL